MKMEIGQKLTILICSMSVSYSVMSNDAETNLGSFGETKLQQNMGDAIQTVCGGFVKNQDAVSEQQSDLFNRCGEMVHSANELLGLSVISKSLGVSGKELASIIQQVAGEEVISQSSVVTDTMSGQNAMIGSRISTLLNRTAGMQYLTTDDKTLYASNNKILGMGASGDEAGLSEKLSIFVNASLGSGEKDATDNEDGFDLDTGSFIVGLDYRVSENTVFGMSLGWDSNDADYDVNQRVSGGQMSVESSTTSFYALHNRDNYYLSGILGVGKSDFDTSRRVLYSSYNQTAQGANRYISSETESDQINMSFTWGYQMVDEARTINPYIKFNYLKIDIDGFAEKDSQNGGGLGLKYQDQSVKSLRGVLGVQASWVINKDFGVLSPYAIAEWHNEFEKDANNITAQYIHDPRNNQVTFSSDKADSSFFNVSAGVSVVLPNSFQLFADVSSVIAMEDFSYNSITVGVRKAF